MFFTKTNVTGTLYYLKHRLRILAVVLSLRWLVFSGTTTELSTYSIQFNENTDRKYCCPTAIKQRASIFPNSSVLQRKVYVTASEERRVFALTAVSSTPLSGSKQRLREQSSSIAQCSRIGYTPPWWQKQRLHEWNINTVQHTIHWTLVRIRVWHLTCRVDANLTMRDSVNGGRGGHTKFGV